MAKFIFEWGWWTLNVGEDGGMGYVSNAYCDEMWTSGPQCPIRCVWEIHGWSLMTAPRGGVCRSQGSSPE